MRKKQFRGLPAAMLAGLAISQCQYSALTTAQGTFIDDLLIYRLGSSHFSCVSTLSNQDKDFEWIKENILGNTEIRNRSHDFVQLAIQGPRLWKS